LHLVSKYGKRVHAAGTSVALNIDEQAQISLTGISINSHSSRADLPFWMGIDTHPPLNTPFQTTQTPTPVCVCVFCNQVVAAFPSVRLFNFSRSPCSSNFSVLMHSSSISFFVSSLCCQLTRNLNITQSKWGFRCVLLIYINKRLPWCPQRVGHLPADAVCPRPSLLPNI
jgi:hypothetical protein